MDIRELDGNQSRILINACQGYDVFREALKEATKYNGGMHWKKVKGKEYLFRSIGRYGGGRSLGARSPETERIYNSFHVNKKKVINRYKSSKAQVVEQARFNKAARIQRVPKLSAKILRLLDQKKLLGQHIMVVGTNAIYAYESAAGVQFDDALIATEDLDFLWDAKRSMKLAIKKDGYPEDFLSILKKIDKTFQIKRDEPFRAANSENFLVDLIKAFPLKGIENKKHIGGPKDLIAAEIMNLEWLLSSPKFKQTAIGDDGLPVYIVAPDPRAFALHKFWTSQQLDRGRTKSARDGSQAIGVAKLVLQYLPMLEFDKAQLRMFPLDLVTDFKAKIQKELDSQLPNLEGPDL